MVWLLRSTGKRKRASQDKSGAKFYNLMQDITGFLTRSKIKKNQPISEEMVWLLRSTGKRKRASQDKSGAKFYNLMQDITVLRVAK